MKKRLDRQCGRGRERMFSNLCVLPSFLGVMAFFLIPFGIVIYYSFVNNPVMKEFVFFDNFKALFSNNAFITAAKNTATFSAIAVPLAVVLALGLAVLLDKKIPGRSIFRTFFRLWFLPHR